MGKIMKLKTCDGELTLTFEKEDDALEFLEYLEKRGLVEKQELKYTRR